MFAMNSSSEVAGMWCVGWLMGWGWGRGMVSMGMYMWKCIGSGRWIGSSEYMESVR